MTTTDRDDQLDRPGGQRSDADDDLPRREPLQCWDTVVQAHRNVEEASGRGTVVDEIDWSAPDRSHQA